MTIVTVDYKYRCIQLPVVVISGDRPSLLGRNWLRHIHIDWRTLFDTCESVNVAKYTAEEMCDRYNDLVSSEMACLTDF